jgi:hypothetical protein
MHYFSWRICNLAFTSCPFVGVVFFSSMSGVLIDGGLDLCMRFCERRLFANLMT